MRATVEIDDELFLDALKDARQNIFESLLYFAKKETYPRPADMEDLSDNMRYLNAINIAIEYFGGVQVDLRGLFEEYEGINHRHPIRD